VGSKQKNIRPNEGKYVTKSFFPDIYRNFTLELVQDSLPLAKTG
jgi:hypothetical protein